MIDKNTIYNAKTIAPMLDMSERRLQQLAKEGIIPKASHGKYVYFDVVHAYVKYLRSLDPDENTETLDLRTEKTRLLTAQADKVEIELAVSRGEMCRVDRAMLLWGRVVAEVRSRMLAIPTKGAPVILGVKSIQEAKGKLKVLLNDALLALREIEPHEYADPDSTEVIQTKIEK